MNEKTILVNSANIGRFVQIQGNVIHYVHYIYHEDLATLSLKDSDAMRMATDIRAQNYSYRQENEKVQYSHDNDENIGETIILLHGLGFSLYSNRDLYAALVEKKYNVIAVDIPGCGYSNMAPHDKYEPEYIAELLKAFLKALKLESAHFFGIAEGAIYAMCLAELYPKAVKTLTIVSPGSITMHYPYLYRQLTIPIVGEIIMRFVNRKSINTMLSWIHFNETSISNTVQRQVYRPFEKKETRLALLYLLRDYDDSAVYSHLYLIETKVLILWGEFDEVHPYTMSNVLRKKIKNNEFLLMKNAGHLVHEQRGSYVGDVIDKFINFNPDKDEK